MWHEEADVGRDHDRDRQEFIEASSTPNHPYAWELDGHPAMQRGSSRRLRNPWRQTTADWVKNAIFLGVVLGMLFLGLGIASLMSR